MAEGAGKLLYVAVLGVVCLLVGWVAFYRYPQINIMKSSEEHPENHVIVIGGGLAGISAAIEATRHGAKVTIIEKESNLGGNSAKATSGINGVGTEGQKRHGVVDSVEIFEKDIISSGDGLSDPKKVRVLAENSGLALDFLQSFGLNLTDVVQLGGHSARRTHRFPPTADGKPVPVGFTILNTLKKYLASDDMKDKVTVHTNSAFQELILKNGKCIGVRYKNAAGAMTDLEGIVILTAGGYANDHTDSSLLVKHTPELAKYPTTNGAWATGDVIKAMEKLDASLIHMDKVQVHPTGFVDSSNPTFHTKFLAPEALRGMGALLLNSEGKRFVNELGRRDHVTSEILNKCKPFQGKDGNPIAATMLLTQEVINKFSAPAAGFYIFKKLIKKMDSLSATASEIGVPEATLKATLQEYARVSAEGKDEFGKPVFPSAFKEDSQFYVAYITPTLHYCMGGLEINRKAEVWVKSDKHDLKVLPGVYAAGEVSGGVHGNNRLGGNSLLECVVFGRIAGFHASHLKY